MKLIPLLPVLISLTLFLILLILLKRQKKQLDKLRNRERMLNTTFDQSYQFIGLLDLEGKIIEINNAARGLVRKDIQDYRDRQLWDVSIFPDDRNLHQWTGEAVKQAQKGITSRKYIEMTPNRGKKIFIDMSVKPILDSRGRPVQIICEGRDITDREEALKLIENLKNSLKSIIDSMPSLLIGVDSGGRITHWNRAAEDRTGVTASEAENRDLYEVFPDFPLEREDLSGPLKENRLWSKRIQNKLNWLELSLFPLVGGTQGRAVIRIDDITEKVRLDELMVNNEKMVSVGGLASGLAHEINTPLSGIIQSADLIRRRLTDSSMTANIRSAEEAGTDMESLVRYMDARGIPGILQAINHSGIRAAAIIKNMLDFTRISDSSFRDCDITELIDNTLELARSDYDLKSKYDFKSIDIIRHYQDDLPPVPCKADKFQQVLLNIVKNAAQALSSRKDSSEPPRIEISLKTERKDLCLVIADNGPGMDEGVRTRVFEPFFTTREIGSATGLGLSVSYFIVTENLNGTISLESSPGRGAVFTIRLPLKQSTHDFKGEVDDEA